MFSTVTAVRFVTNPVSVRYMAGAACVMSRKLAVAVCFTIHPNPMSYMSATAKAMCESFFPTLE